MLFRIRVYHPLWRHFPEPSATALGPTSGSYNPDPNTQQSAYKLAGLQAHKLQTYLRLLPVSLPACQLASQPLCVRVGLGASPFARRY